MIELKTLPSTQPSDLEKALNNLPVGLDATYSRMLNNIPHSVSEAALVLLRWLTYSLRPLTLSELSEARIISLRTFEGEVAFDDRGCLEDILGILPGLILISRSEDMGPNEDDSCSDYDGGIDTTSEGYYGAKDPRLLVYLAHFSVQEYLESSRPQTDWPPQFYFQVDREHQILSHCCLTYLTHYACSRSMTKTSQDLKTFPLLDYAARSCFFHCRETDVEREIQFMQSRAFRDSLLVYDSDNYVNRPFRRRPDDVGSEERSEVYLAIDYGPYTVAEKLIEAGTDINAQGGICGNALQYAAHRAPKSIVKMLIDAGADVNANGGTFGNALQAAVHRRDESIVRMLIDAGAVSDSFSVSSSGSGANGNFTVTFQKVSRVSRVIEGKKKITLRSPCRSTIV